jgi:hypothetical protein
VQLQINLDGYEPPHIIDSAIAALRAYGDIAKDNYKEYAFSEHGFQSATLATQQPAPDQIAEGCEGYVAPDQIAAPKATKSQTKRKAAQQATPADEVPPDATPPAEPDEDDVKIEDIRAVAAKFNTDPLRELAMGILAKHSAQSVSELAKRDKIIRVSVLADLKKTYAAQEAA